MGPIIDQAAKTRLLELNQQASNARVKTLHEGKSLGDLGCYLTPALRIGEWQEHDYFTQEHFGPDLVLIPIKNAEEGLRRINSLDYGLAAAIFCKDQEQFDNWHLGCGVVWSMESRHGWSNRAPSFWRLEKLWQPSPRCSFRWSFSERGTGALARWRIGVRIRRGGNELMKQLGLLPLRNDVFFPGAVLQLTVGRPASVALINAVQEGNIDLGVLSQRDASVESPSREDLFEVGTYASIISVMQTNTDRFQVMVKGLARFRLASLDESGEFLRAEVEDMPSSEDESEQLNQLVTTVREQSLSCCAAPGSARAAAHCSRGHSQCLADVIALIWK